VAATTRHSSAARHRARRTRCTSRRRSARRVARRPPARRAAARKRARVRPARCRKRRRKPVARRRSAPKRTPSTPATPPPPPSTSTPPPPPPGTPSPARLLVTAREYSLALSRPQIPAGDAIVQLDNRGQDPHDLAIRHGAGPASALIAETPSLQVATAPRAPLAAGTYTLFCDLPGHAALGMQATLTVG